MTRRLQEALFELRMARWAIAAAALWRGRMYLRAGRLYRGLNDLCWIVRVSNAGALQRIARRLVFDTVAALRTDPDNALVASYRADPASEACASLFSMAGTGSADLFRDLIVLKRATPDEKGVILLKYARTFSAVMALLDMPRLMQRYTFVLEPCWAGYCDPSLLMFVTPGHPVFVQCFTEEDCRFVSDVGAPLVPLRLGPADWVDADLFAAPAAVEKTYDLVMVANWGSHKRHAQLFRALTQVTDRHVRVLLIGFPWAGRTAADIRREAAAIGNERVQVDVVEKLPAREVAARVSQCKVFVFLSRKEGDNKALVESMFAGVPAIVYDRSIGGAASRINPATGILASDEELGATIAYMLDHYRAFTPGEWARAHSGSAIATRLLDDTMRRVVTASGGRYTESIVEKTNSPNLTYKDPASRARFQADYDFIRSCRREPHTKRRDTVTRGAVRRDAVA
ncbi:MAG: glycosyltransferase [Vicinamibacterales bacterium]